VRPTRTRFGYALPPPGGKRLSSIAYAKAVRCAGDALTPSRDVLRRAVPRDRVGLLLAAPRSCLIATMAGTSRRDAASHASLKQLRLIDYAEGQPVCARRPVADGPLAHEPLRIDVCDFRFLCQIPAPQPKFPVAIRGQIGDC